jgi:hypothetical protein
LTVPPEIEAGLRQRAAVAGESVDDCALRILRDAVVAVDEAIDWNPIPPLRSATAQGIIQKRQTGTPIPYEPAEDE